MGKEEERPRESEKIYDFFFFFRGGWVIRLGGEILVTG